MQDQLKQEIIRKWRTSSSARADLLRNLVWAELTARYRTTILGVLWFVLNPILSMVILIVIFKVFVNLDIPNYPVFVLSALLPWTFFQMALTNASGSIPRSSSLVKKVRIPRSFIPLSAILASLIHFVISFVVLFILMAAESTRFTPFVLCLPVVIAFQMCFVVGLGVMMACLNVIYRDVEFILDPLLRAMFYFTPIIYPLSWVPRRFLNWYLLNPMSGIVEIYRQTLTAGQLPSLRVLGITVIGSVVTLIVGLTLFGRYEPYFDDYL
jgi:lipopolysaccharide transport system permease protein